MMRRCTFLLWLAFTNNQFVHSGKYSVRFDRTSSSTLSFSTITQSIPIDFSGKTIIWRGWIKMQNADDYVALWANEFNTWSWMGIVAPSDQQHTCSMYRLVLG